MCVAGIVIEPHILHLSELRINDLATLPSERSKGLGQLMLEHIEQFARDAKCFRIMLYSRVTNTEAHRFYVEKAKYKRHGTEFIKVL